MKTIILLLVLSVLVTGYSVATKATSLVNAQVQAQQQQLAAIGR